MNLTDLQKILKKGENEFAEFKASFNQETLVSLCAFANTKGGSVILGITDEGKVQGLTPKPEDIPNWINEVKNKTYPSLIPDAEVLEKNGKKVVILSIAEFPIKPVSLQGRYYKRIKNSNHQMSPSEISEVHLRAMNGSFDYYFDDRHDLSDIDLGKVEKLISLLNKRGQNITESPLEFLQKTELIREGKLSRACFFLFLKERSVLTTIELGHFQTETIIKDSHRLQMDILTEVDEVMSFIKKHINKEIIITGNPQNTERWDYPLEALREIVLNMIIHRDYSSPADSIVKIFPDRIVFYNPGRLMPGLSLDKLFSNNYTSTPRNKLVANIFKDIGLIEKYGSGIRRIREGILNWGLLEPQIVDDEGGFTVTVYRASTPQVTPQVTLQVTPQVAKLLSFLDKELTRDEIQEFCGIKDRMYFSITYLKPAIEQGLVEMTIPDKPNSRLQKYRLTELGKKLKGKR